jgi:anti-sigma-K factor RskA
MQAVGNVAVLIHGLVVNRQSPYGMAQLIPEERGRIRHSPDRSTEKSTDREVKGAMRTWRKAKEVMAATIVALLRTATMPDDRRKIRVMANALDYTTSDSHLPITPGDQHFQIKPMEHRLSEDGERNSNLQVDQVGNKGLHVG